MSIPEFVVRLCALVLIGLACVSTAGAQLPPEIQVDRLLVQAEREAEEGNPWTAASTLEQALEMYEEHGLEIPGDFWIRYAQALQAARLHEEAIEASTRYLEESGREGEHYLTALRLLDEAEVGLAEDRREEARRRVEAQRVAEEAAAREAATLEAVMANLPGMVVISAGTYRMGCVSGRTVRRGTNARYTRCGYRRFRCQGTRSRSRSGTYAWSTVRASGRATKAGAVAIARSST